MKLGFIEMKYKRAFTLIEMVTTVVVMATLAAVAIPAYRSYVMRSRTGEAPGMVMELARLELEYWAKPHVDSATGAARFPCYQATSPDISVGGSSFHPARNFNDLHAGPLYWTGGPNGAPPRGFDFIGFNPSGLLSYTYGLVAGPALGVNTNYCYNSDVGGAIAAADGQQLTVKAVGDLDEDSSAARLDRQFTIVGGQPRMGALTIYSDDY